MKILDFGLAKLAEPMVEGLRQMADGQRFLLSAIVETEVAAPVMVVINWTANLKQLKIAAECDSRPL